MSKRPAARRIHEPLPSVETPVPRKASWGEVDEHCRKVFGCSAREIAVGMIYEDFHDKQLPTLPKGDPVKAIAALLGSPDNRQTDFVAKILVATVRNRL